MCSIALQINFVYYFKTGSSSSVSSSLDSDSSDYSTYDDTDTGNDDFTSLSDSTLLSSKETNEGNVRYIVYVLNDKYQ